VVDWNAITAIATAISTVAFILTALYVRAELKGLEKDRYLTITNQMFDIWESSDFLSAQLWLLHRLEETTWPDFVKAHRADTGEAAFHRVGSFYNRLGTLIRLGLVRQEQILPTVGGHAIAVWQKIRPLVEEARRLEHSMLFSDFERLLPACIECYVPSATGPGAEQPASQTLSEEKVPTISVRELHRKLEQGEPITLLDVRQPAQIIGDPRALPGALSIPSGQVENRLSEVPRDREVVVYCA
jgi:hypothetical protein